jgi:hypothetical protein
MVAIFTGKDGFGDKAAHLDGRTTPPTDPDERNERIQFLRERGFMAHRNEQC